MTARMDSQKIASLVGQTVWLNGGSYTRAVKIIMVRNELVFFAHQKMVDGEMVTEIDRYTMQAFLQEMTVGQEHAQYHGQREATIENVHGTVYIEKINSNSHYF